jgi:hypothetical protein
MVMRACVRKRYRSLRARWARMANACRLFCGQSQLRVGSVVKQISSLYAAPGPEGGTCVVERSMDFAVDDSTSGAKAILSRE